MNWPNGDRFVVRPLRGYNIDPKRPRTGTGSMKKTGPPTTFYVLDAAYNYEVVRTIHAGGNSERARGIAEDMAADLNRAYEEYVGSGVGQ